MKSPLKVLCLFDYGPNTNTGFATVSKNIIPHVKRIISKRTVLKLDIVAINHFGDRYKEDENTEVISAVKSMPLSKTPDLKDDFGRYGFLHILGNSNEDVPGDNCPPQELGYDGIFIIQDPGIISSIIPNLDAFKQKFKKENKRQFKSIVYFPIDHDITSDAVIRRMEFFDEIVTYNEFSRDQILKLRPSWKRKIRTIPHGINLKEFYVLPDTEKLKFRREYFGENADKFIVLNLNRNQPRKDIPCTIFAFEEFHKKHPNSFLYLHMNPEDPMGWNLRFLLSQTSLEEGRDYMFPPKQAENHATDIATLNKIYNSADVYVTTTLGEGWGLSVVEAMATRTPVICPYHTSLIEISGGGDRAYCLENLYPIAQIFDSTKRDQCDYIEVANKLYQVKCELNIEKSGINHRLDLAQEYIESLSWDFIGEQWADLMIKTY